MEVVGGGVVAEVVDGLGAAVEDGGGVGGDGDGAQGGIGDCGQSVLDEVGGGAYVGGGVLGGDHLLERIRLPQIGGEPPVGMRTVFLSGIERVEDSIDERARRGGTELAGHDVDVVGVVEVSAEMEPTKRGQALLDAHVGGFERRLIGIITIGGRPRPFACFAGDGFENSNQLLILAVSPFQILQGEAPVVSRHDSLLGTWCRKKAGALNQSDAVGVCFSEYGRTGMLQAPLPFADGGEDHLAFDPACGLSSLAQGELRRAAIIVPRVMRAGDNNDVDVGTGLLSPLGD